MKKKGILAAGLILVLVFFPISTVHRISGSAEVLTLQKEKTGTCELEIEIKEISSLAIRYKKEFTFALDGNSAEVLRAPSYAEAEDLRLLSQMYYDKDLDEMRLCSLVYQEDLSYAVLRFGENYYFINNGADISYAELPVS